MEQAGLELDNVLLDSGGQQTIGRLHHLARREVRRVGALQRHHAPQDDQGRRPAGPDHRHEGQDQLLGHGQVLQHDVRLRQREVQPRS